MSTRILLIASGLFMLALGLAASFFPQEVLFYARMQPTNLGILLVQATGALYAGFGVVNWAARGTQLGWENNRPLALGNFLHFTMMTVALVKALIAGALNPTIAAFGLLYLLFAVLFGGALVTRPAPTPARRPRQTWGRAGV